MNETTCDEAGPLVEAWRDALLEPARASLVEAHLLECPECSAGPGLEFLDYVEELEFEPSEKDRWRSVLFPTQSARLTTRPARFFALVALAGAVAAGMLLSVSTGLFNPEVGVESSPARPGGASFGSHGSGEDGTAAPPKRRSLTIMSEGDVRLNASQDPTPGTTPAAKTANSPERREGH